MSDIDEIRKRLEACPIPESAEADWDGTNHYEINDPRGEDYLWLDGTECQNSSTEDGKRLGAVLDYACAYRRDVGALLGRIADLDATLTEAVHLIGQIQEANAAIQKLEVAFRETPDRPLSGRVNIYSFQKFQTVQLDRLRAALEVARKS